MAHAMINVSPKLARVWDQAISIEIFNQGDHPEFVSITLSQLINPGVPPGDEILVPVSASLNPTLFAFPFKFSLGTGQSKKVIIKPLMPVVQETVYRLNVKPINNMLADGTRKISGSIVVNASYSTLIRQLPKDGHDTLSIACIPSGATLTATGNVRSTVQGLMVDGIPRETFNVYPGVSHTVLGKLISLPSQPTCKR